MCGSKRYLALILDLEVHCLPAAVDRQHVVPGYARGHTDEEVPVSGTTGKQQALRLGSRYPPVEVRLHALHCTGKRPAGKQVQNTGCLEFSRKRNRYSSRPSVCGAGGCTALYPRQQQ